jgi:protein associated with RNAse G/E
MKELDEKEFEQHVLTYGYPPDLTSAIRKSFEEIKQMMEKKEFPFLESDVELIYQKFLNDNQPFKKAFSTVEKK